MSIEELFDHCRLGDQTHKRMSAQYRVVERKPTDIRLINCSVQLVEEKQKEMFFRCRLINEKHREMLAQCTLVDEKCRKISAQCRLVDEHG